MPVTAESQKQVFQGKGGGVDGYTILYLPILNLLSSSHLLLYQSILNIFQRPLSPQHRTAAHLGTFPVTNIRIFF